jgi:hypothetical protein
MERNSLFYELTCIVNIVLSHVSIVIHTRNPMTEIVSHSSLLVKKNPSVTNMISTGNTKNLLSHSSVICPRSTVLKREFTDIVVCILWEWKLWLQLPLVSLKRKSERNNYLSDPWDGVSVSTETRLCFEVWNDILQCSLRWQWKSWFVALSFSRFNRSGRLLFFQSLFQAPLLQ